ncbi:MAG: acetyl-CoA decarbonylase/synthase complex subunit gamma [Dehalococcoidales bacterium]
MALSGIEIFKLLPKTNCGDCGVPTCLAFAMSIAAGKSELDKCPHLSSEVRIKLEEASAPPIRAIIIGAGERMVKTGGETVMFRHEKRFENPPPIAFTISDSMDESRINKQFEQFESLHYERAGNKLKAEMLAIRYDSGDAEKYTSVVESVINKTDAALILICSEPGVLEKALQVSAPNRPLIYAANKNNADTMLELAKKYTCPLAIKAENLEKLAELAERITAGGFKELVLDSGARTIKQAFNDQIAIRRSALINKYRPLGFPTIVFPGEMSDTPLKETLYASILIAKYAGLVVLNEIQAESLFTLLVERMNIFTDPQRPLATKEGIYEIGSPDENSPVLLTSNFSLTYFLLTGEIESSRVPAYLLVKNTEGLSIMTAWAAGKFSADNISQFVKKSGIEEKIAHRKLIIPGYVDFESAGLEEELEGWEILIGPREASHLPTYLKNWGAGK